ncbi:MAG: MCE family protein, partial [Aeromicrobium erythreum]
RAARLPVGATIPKQRTAAALELDTLLNGFKPLFVGLSPRQINTLSEQLVLVLQGQSSAVTTLVSTVNSFATTIGSRDELVGQVVDNLNTVLGTLDRRGDALGTVVDQLSLVVKGLDRQAPEVLTAASQLDGLSRDASALLGRARTDLSPTLDSLRGTAATLNQSQAMVERTLRAYPDHYKLVLRTGSFGSFFNFFLCGVKVRLSPESEDSQVVELPWITSDVSRCKA